MTRSARVPGRRIVVNGTVRGSGTLGPTDGVPGVGVDGAVEGTLGLPPAPVVVPRPDRMSTPTSTATTTAAAASPIHSPERERREPGGGCGPGGDPVGRDTVGPVVIVGALVAGGGTGEGGTGEGGTGGAGMGGRAPSRMPAGSSSSAPWISSWQVE